VRHPNRAKSHTATGVLKTKARANAVKFGFRKAILSSAQRFNGIQAGGSEGWDNATHQGHYREY